MFIKTEGYYKAAERIVEVGETYYFGELWNGEGDGEELIESGCVEMYDEYEDEKTVEFKVIERDDDTMETLVKVIGID